MVLTAAVGFFVLRRALDAAARLGIGLVVAGVVVMNLFSHTTGHERERAPAGWWKSRRPILGTLPNGGVSAGKIPVFSPT